MSSTGVHLVAARKRSQARVFLSLHCRVELSRRGKVWEEILSKWTKILTCCSMFCRFSIVADLGISSYRPGRFDTCSVIKEQMSEALISSVKKTHSSWCRSRPRGRQGTGRERRQRLIEKPCGFIIIDIDVFVLLVPCLYWSICLFDKSQSWTFKTSNICWRVRIINLSHWLFSTNIPQAQAREHIRKTTPRPVWGHQDMAAWGQEDIGTRGHGDVRTRGDKDDKDMWIVNCDLAGEPSGVRVENW